MSDMRIQLGAALFRDLQYAAIQPEKRDFFIFRSLNKYVSMMGATGVALVRYSEYNVDACKIAYCGPNQLEVENWLHERVSSSVELTIANLNTLPTALSHTKTQFTPYDDGLLIIWHHKKIDIFDKHHTLLLDGLKAISYVEKQEQLYFYDTERLFDPELNELIKHKDKSGLTELLSLTKTIGNSDFVFWGDANSKYIEVATHLGSYDSGFGFQLPVGQGIGGKAAQNRSLLQVNDYKNCEYRYQEVSTAVDQEDVRTVLALPVKDQKANTSGVLYVSNRKIQPFSLDTKFMLLRVGHGIEPLTKQTELKHFFVTNQYSNFVKQKKGELRQIIQNGKQIFEMEEWLEELTRGRVEIVDHKGTSYTSRRSKKIQIEQQPYVFSLQDDHQNIGNLLIWTDMTLPPQEWSDFIDDIMSAIYVIYEREQRIHHVLDLEHSQWIHNLLNNSTDINLQYKRAIRLQFPVDHGEVWSIYWDLNDEQLHSRERIKLEEIVLKCTKSPLIFLRNIGFILFDKASPCQPEVLRNELLKELPVSTWIVHSATYSSFHDLKSKLKQLRLLVEKITTVEQKEFVIGFNHFGLELLLTNPNIANDLNEFSFNALRPIIDYDQRNETQFTNTLALSLVYQSPTLVAEKMYIHTNTVHYRVNRAKELLNINLNKPENDVALRFASYIWLYNQQQSALPSDE